MTILELCLKRLDKAFPTRAVLTAPAVAEYLGIETRTVKKHITPTAGAEKGKTKYYSKEAIAAYMAGGREY